MSPSWSLIILLVALVGPIRSERQCMPMKECEAAYHLLVNRDRQDLHGMTSRDVLTHLRSLICGYTPDNDIKVMCEDNTEAEEEEEEEAEDPGGITSANLDEVAARSGGVFHTQGEDSECGGSLKLYHFNPDRTSFQTLNLHGRQYAKLRKLRDRTVYDAQVDGTCCWMVSSLAYYRGERETMSPIETRPSFQPKAAKKIMCTKKFN